jgi:hypothetical protein
MSSPKEKRWRRFCGSSLIDGAGTRTDPHRYFLPEAMARDLAMSPLGSPQK